MNINTGNTPKETIMFTDLFVTLAQTVYKSLSTINKDLSNLNILILMSVYHHPGITMSELAQAVGVSSAQLSRMVGILEDKRLVERRHNKENRRQVNVFGTIVGEELVQENYDIALKKITKKLEVLSNSEKDSLKEHISEVIKLLAKADIVKQNPRDIVKK